MKAFCIDDEEIILNYVVSLCKKHPQLDEVYGFTSSDEAIEQMKKSPADIVLLDINMPGEDGLKVAEKLLNLWPDVAIIFLTGHQEYALDAFSLHASGYLLKPVNNEKLNEEINHAIDKMHVTPDNRIFIRTFGEFEVYVDGAAVHFKRQKSKEVLAFLVDRQGASVTRSQIFTELWEDGDYDRSMQKQLDVFIRSMRDTLDEYNITEIIEMNRGELRVVPEAFGCDLYRFLQGDQKTKSMFRGEYMNAYTWASAMEGYITYRL